MKPARWRWRCDAGPWGAAHVANLRYSQASDDEATWAKGGPAKRRGQQAEAVPAHSETQVTAAISLNQIRPPATQRDWGTQTGATQARTARQEPTRFAACTVFSASQYLAAN
jgi:hypothetical protein